MRVIMLSTKDFAGSGYKLCRAIEHNTDVHIRIVTERVHEYGYEVDYNLQTTAKNFIQNLINRADIIHFKGDELPRNTWKGLSIPDVPIIISVGGSGFRRHGDDDKVALHWHELEEYVQATDFRTALTPDLNYPLFDGVYTPQCMESVEFSYQHNEAPIIAHSPSVRAKKGTNEYIIPALDRLRQDGYVFELDMIENVSNAECIERKRKASIFIDQISHTGWYGISGIEAITAGIPTIAHISSDALNQSSGIIDMCEVVNADLNIESTYNAIKSLLDLHTSGLLQNKAADTYRYAQKVHSEQASSKQFYEIYKHLYDNNTERIIKAHEIHNIKPLPGGMWECMVLNKKIGAVGDVRLYPHHIARELENNHSIRVLRTE